MKKLSVILTIFSVFITGGIAIAGECRLDTPIKIDESALSKGTSFKSIKTDVRPKFLSVDQYNENSDKIYLNLVNVAIDSGKTAFFGANIGLESKRSWMGCANGFFGNLVDVSGENTSENGVNTYRVQAITHQNQTDLGIKDLVTKSSFTVENGDLTSVSFTYPIERFIKIENYDIYAQYTGEEQTVCVKSIVRNDI